MPYPAGSFRDSASLRPEVLSDLLVPALLLKFFEYPPSPQNKHMCYFYLVGYMSSLEGERMESIQNRSQMFMDVQTT